MKKTMTENQENNRKELKEAFALWLHESKSGNEYLSGLTSEELGKNRLVAYFNSMKKKPKEPDIRIYKLDKEGKQEKEVADLWQNESKNKKLYLSGSSDEKEKLIGFYGDKKETKNPYIRVYFN